MAADALEIATPERVSVDLPLAGIGYRTLAYLIDAGVLFAAWVVLYFVLTLVQTDVLASFQALSGVAQTLMGVGIFAGQWVYWTACEVLWGGRSVGKRALRIRVVRTDGTEVGVLESAVRNLLRAVDFLPAAYAGGVLTVLLTRRHQRLGDLVAGTVLVRDEQVDLDRYAAPARTAGGAPLPHADVELILGYLERAPSLAVEAREKLAWALVDRFGRGLDEAGRAQIKSSVASAEAYLAGRARAGA
jgi:uncharacterized RDD family membrane protein YckC